MLGYFIKGASQQVVNSGIAVYEYYIAGLFSIVNSVQRLRYVKLDNEWNIVSGYTATSLNNNARCISVRDDGKAIIGGAFTSPRTRIVQIAEDGTVDTNFGVGTGFNAIPDFFLIQSTGAVIATGAFTSYRGSSYSRLVRISTNGTIDTSFDIGTGFNSRTIAIIPVEDNNLLVGGEFTSFRNTGYNYIVKITNSGGIASGFSIGQGFNDRVHGLAMLSDGKYVAVGRFTSYDGLTRNRIVKLNVDGTVDTSFSVGTGFNAECFGVTALNDGKCIVAGTFTSYNNVTSNRVVLLNSDGSIDTSFDIGTGFNNTVNYVATQPMTNKLIASGFFTEYDSTTRLRLAEINRDGTLTSKNVDINNITVPAAVLKL